MKDNSHSNTTFYSTDFSNIDIMVKKNADKLKDMQFIMCCIRCLTRFWFDYIL